TYPGIPNGQTPAITVEDGVANMVSTVPDEHTETGVRHAWASGLVRAHLTRATASSPLIAARPAWHRLTTSDAVNFVLGAEDAYPALPGRFGGTARQVGDLAVLASMFAVTDARTIRRQLTAGYMFLVAWLLDRLGVRRW